MPNFDNLKLSVEALSGGKNTVLFDDLGMPSIVVNMPKLKNSDIMAGGLDTTHAAFIVGGVEKDLIRVSKYQNIVMNDRAYSLPFKDPKASLNFDQAKTYCENKGAGWHLMTNAEWAAIALWCHMNGTMPRGNNNYGEDYSAAHEKGVETYGGGDPYKTYRVATGSGPAAWAHDNTNDGIFDLNGNVWEWVGGLRLNNGEIQIIPNNDAAQQIDQSATSTLWKAILQDGSLVDPGTVDTLKYDATNADGSGNVKLNTTVVNQSDGSTSASTLYKDIAAEAGVTAPDILKLLGLFPHAADIPVGRVYQRNLDERLPYRGGNWDYTSNAGVFALHLFSPRSYVHTSLGFRSAFVS